jgi:hypothetical protein
MLSNAKRMAPLPRAARPGELSPLDSQRNGSGNKNDSERRTQASRCDAVDAGANNCRCFVHGANFPLN